MGEIAQPPAVVAIWTQCDGHPRAFPAAATHLVL